MYVNNLYEWLAHTEQPAELQPLSLQIWKKKNSSLVIERTLQSLTPGVISVCFLPGSEDRTPGGSVVTNLDNLKSSFTPVAAEVGRNLVNSTESKIVS